MNFPSWSAFVVASAFAPVFCSCRAMERSNREPCRVEPAPAQDALASLREDARQLAASQLAQLQTKLEANERSALAYRATADQHYQEHVAIALRVASVESMLEIATHATGTRVSNRLASLKAECDDNRAKLVETDRKLTDQLRTTRGEMKSELNNELDRVKQKLEEVEGVRKRLEDAEKTRERAERERGPNKPCTCERSPMPDPSQIESACKRVTAELTSATQLESNVKTALDALEQRRSIVFGLTAEQILAVLAAAAAAVIAARKLSRAQPQIDKLNDKLAKATLETAQLQATVAALQATDRAAGDDRGSPAGTILR